MVPAPISANAVSPNLNDPFDRSDEVICLKVSLTNFSEWCLSEDNQFYDYKATNITNISFSPFTNKKSISLK